MQQIGPWVSACHPLHPGLGPAGASYEKRIAGIEDDPFEQEMERLINLDIVQAVEEMHLRQQSMALGEHESSVVPQE